jgi:hypothetical protein
VMQRSKIIKPIYSPSRMNSKFSPKNKIFEKNQQANED